MNDFISALMDELEKQKAIYINIRKNTYCRVTETSECDSCRADHYLDARLDTIDDVAAIIHRTAGKMNKE